jgi:hypothetical protein
VRTYHLYELYARRDDIGSPQDFVTKFKGAILSNYIDVSKCDVFDATEADRRIWDACENMAGLDCKNFGFFEDFKKRCQAQREVATGRLSERKFYRLIDQDKFYNQWAGRNRGFTTRLAQFLDPSVEKVPEVWGNDFNSITDEQWWRKFVKIYVKNGELRTIDDLIDLMSR